MVFKMVMGADEICASCQAGTIGCVACKKQLAAKLDEFIAPVRERRVYFAQRPNLVEEILAAGNEAARKEAKETLGLVREVRWGCIYTRSIWRAFRVPWICCLSDR